MLDDISSEYPKVSSLMSSVGELDVLKVRQIFPVVEAEAILNIHLSPQCCGDSRFWHGNPKGINL